MKNYIVFILLVLVALLLYVNSFGGNSNRSYKLDSLFKKVILLADDTMKVLKLNELSFQYLENQLDTSFILGQKALNLSEKLDYEFGRAKSLFTLGLVFKYQGDYDKAIQYSEESFEIFDKHNRNVEKVKVLSSLGNIYKRKGDFDKSIHTLLQVMEIYEGFKDSVNLSSVYNNLGALYLEIENYNKSLHYHKQNLELKKKLRVGNEAMLIALINIANVYNEKKDYNKAVGVYKEAMGLMDESISKYNQLLLFHNLGNIYGVIGSYTSAKQYYFKAIRLGEEIGDQDMRIYSLQGLGYVLIKTGDYIGGIDYLQRAYDLASKKGDIAKRKKISESLSWAYECSKDYKHGLYYFKIFQGLNDSLLGLAKMKQINEIQVRYDTEKKEQQLEMQDIKLAEQEYKIRQQKILRNSLFGGMAAFFIIALLAAYAYYMKRRANQKIAFQIEEIETQAEHLSESNIILQQQALSAQMNPHFIFNTLNSIQYFIYNNDKEESNKYLSKFSKLMRIVLDNSQQQLILIEKELEALELYLELESLRFGNKFTYTINCEEEALEYKIPALLIQPFVENAIVHGLANKKEGEGQLNITIKLENEYIVCTIEDDGVGRLEAIKLRKGKGINHKSLGTKITQKRLDIANSLYGEKMNVKYTDKIGEDCKALGTKVEITLPLME